MPSVPKEVALRSIRKHAELVAERITARDTAIALAHREGVSFRDIGEAAGLNHQTVKNICDRLAADEQSG